MDENEMDSLVQAVYEAKEWSEFVEAVKNLINRYEALKKLINKISEDEKNGF